MVGFVRAKLRARFAKMQSLTSVAKGFTSIQQREFPLAIAEPIPVTIAAESIIRGIRALGY
jgi:hypothetical protein